MRDSLHPHIIESIHSDDPCMTDIGNVIECSIEGFVVFLIDFDNKNSLRQGRGLSVHARPISCFFDDPL